MFIYCRYNAIITFEVLTVVNVKKALFWDATLCTPDS
jgi:hypothetical protein